MSSQQLPGTDSSFSLLPFFPLKSRAFSVTLLEHTQKTINFSQKMLCPFVSPCYKKPDKI